MDANQLIELFKATLDPQHRQEAENRLEQVLLLWITITIC